MRAPQVGLGLVGWIGSCVSLVLVYLFLLVEILSTVSLVSISQLPEAMLICSF